MQIDPTQHRSAFDRIRCSGRLTADRDELLLHLVLKRLVQVEVPRSRMNKQLHGDYTFCKGYVEPQFLTMVGIAVFGRGTTWSKMHKHGSRSLSKVLAG